MLRYTRIIRSSKLDRSGSYGIIQIQSPFPGMNPFIEQDAFWHDFHLEFLPAIRARLVAQVRPKYIVMLDEHLYVQEVLTEPRRLVGHSDVSVASAKRTRRKESVGAVGILDAPAQVHIPVQDRRRVPFLEVRDRLGRELITVVEMLSPSNKRAGADREQFVANREELLQSTAHFVEINNAPDQSVNGPNTRIPTAGNFGTQQQTSCVGIVPNEKGGATRVPTGYRLIHLAPGFSARLIVP